MHNRMLNVLLLNSIHPCSCGPWSATVETRYDPRDGISAPEVPGIRRPMHCCSPELTPPMVNWQVRRGGDSLFPSGSKSGNRGPIQLKKYPMKILTKVKFKKEICTTTYGFLYIS